jgi:cytoskeletal protein RodZ
MGAYLRAARRRRRVSIERAAEETRIKADFLMRMESDEFDFLAVAYVRGFLRTYARYLRVDPEPLTREFDRRFGGGRLDTASIVALERRSQTAPKEPRKFTSWGLAAVLATGLLALLAIVGVLSGPGNEPRGDVAVERESPSPSEEATPTTSPTTATPTIPAEIAFDEGMTVQVAAIDDRCWIDVTADGVNSFSGTLEIGDSETFTAEDEMSIVFGYPAGVEVTVNGVNIGAPGEADPVTIKLPDDIEALL